MFWFAGLVGMGIESKRVRKWLAASIFNSVANVTNVPQDTITEPPSYSASLNPFPALVIGVTGAAMAAHFQTYLFQVRHLSRTVYFDTKLCSRQSSISIGANSRCMGKFAGRILCLAVSHLFLPLARPSTFNPSVSPTHRSAWQLFPGMWRFSFYLFHRRNHSCCNAPRTRW
jgi:hypothetical protein